MAYGCADKKTAGKTAEEEYESLIKYIWRYILLRKNKTNGGK